MVFLEMIYGYCILEYEILYLGFWCDLVYSSVCFSAAASSIFSPVELIRVKMQSQQLTYGQLADALRTSVRANGTSYLWNGLSASLFRDIPFSGIGQIGEIALQEIFMILLTLIKALSSHARSVSAQLVHTLNVCLLFPSTAAFGGAKPHTIPQHTLYFCPLLISSPLIIIIRTFIMKIYNVPKNVKKLVEFANCTYSSFKI